MSYRFKRIVKLVIISLSFTALWIFTLGRSVPRIQAISDGLFIVGLLLFFWGLITLTRASNIFISTNYIFKLVFRRNFRAVSYHEYMSEREVKADNEGAWHNFLVGLSYLVISFTIANVIL